MPAEKRDRYRQALDCPSIIGFETLNYINEEAFKYECQRSTMLKMERLYKKNDEILSKFCPRMI